MRSSSNRPTSLRSRGRTTSTNCAMRHGLYGRPSTRPRSRTRTMRHSKAISWSTRSISACGPVLPHCQPTVVTALKPSTAGSTRRGHRLTARSKPASSKASSSSCPCSTRTQTCTGRFAPRAKCTQSRRPKASQDRSRPSTSCSNQGRCWA